MAKLKPCYIGYECIVKLERLRSRALCSCPVVGVGERTTPGGHSYHVRSPFTAPRPEPQTRKRTTSFFPFAAVWDDTRFPLSRSLLCEQHLSFYCLGQLNSTASPWNSG